MAMIAPPYTILRSHSVLTLPTDTARSLCILLNLRRIRIVRLRETVTVRLKGAVKPFEAIVSAEVESTCLAQTPWIREFRDRRRAVFQQKLPLGMRRSDN
ncbi:hypothetical protein Mal48_48920 [Thalassoglobus polymorphus]|uniref:Uncharacterized protein n=1 Tax=Thalassoglobus polymorphus TaxID=2527994 RepID=A0A517QVL2_9PLAN|nr:hypothetical protein Mal48_48920 [Thalassoglobus polymorphus]